jgi:hypothetical protein
MVAFGRQSRAWALVLACIACVGRAGTLPEGLEFLERNAKKDGVSETESGMQRVLPAFTATLSPDARRLRYRASAGTRS